MAGLADVARKTAADPGTVPQAVDAVLDVGEHAVQVADHAAERGHDLGHVGGVKGREVVLAVGLVLACELVPEVSVHGAAGFKCPAGAVAAEAEAVAVLGVLAVVVPVGGLGVAGLVADKVGAGLGAAAALGAPVVLLAACPTRVRRGHWRAGLRRLAGTPLGVVVAGNLGADVVWQGLAPGLGGGAAQRQSRGVAHGLGFGFSGVSGVAARSREVRRGIAMFGWVAATGRRSALIRLRGTVAAACNRRGSIRQGGTVAATGCAPADPRCCSCPVLILVAGLVTPLAVQE